MNSTEQKDGIPKSGLCVFYLNCGNVEEDKVDELIKKSKARIFDSQGLSSFLQSKAHHFVIVPVFGEPTRMEFIWF